MIRDINNPEFDWQLIFNTLFRSEINRNTTIQL